jgi:septal ring factor EnvC (AmiA/AmiB activator)
VSDDRLTVCETRELLTESLCRAQDCAADLVQEVSERDATIARLTAELAEARAALREHAENCDRCHERTATRSAAMRAQVEARDAAVREYLAAEANADEAHTGSLCIVGEMGSDEVDAAGDRIVAAIKTLAAARAALVALVGGAM